MKKYTKEFINDFEDKYSTDVPFEDILKNINYQERIDEAKKFKEYYDKKLKVVTKRLSIVFSVLLVCFVILTVGIVSKKSLNHHTISIEHILSEREKKIFFNENNQHKEKYLLISLENCSIYIFNTFHFNPQKRDEKIYTYYYKVIFDKDNNELTLNINNQEYLITNNNPFGTFYTISKEEGELITLSFSIEYQGIVRYYQFKE